VANNVAAPIEQQVNGADNMIYMNSSSSATGNMTLNVFFEIGTDPSLAQVDVQNRVNLALPQLPSAVQSQGIQVQKKSSAFMMVLAVYSAGERYDSTYVANYANLYILDAIKRIPGRTRPASSARRTTPCGSGSSPTAWPSWASPPPMCRKPSPTRTSSSPWAGSASRQRGNRSSSLLP
jgi:hypothetical protein